MPLYTEDDIEIVNKLLLDIADLKSYKFEQLIHAASQSNNEGETSFLAGGIDALSAIVQNIENIILDLKQKRNEE